MSSIKVPPLGESIVEATVSRWLKNEGDAVAVGDGLVELETDKITVEVPALEAGVLTSRAKGEGDVRGGGRCAGRAGGRCRGCRQRVYQPQRLLHAASSGRAGCRGSGRDGRRQGSPRLPRDWPRKPGSTRPTSPERDAAVW
ncbi:MAG: hypothetical protein HEQ11_01270 [Gemmatimonas sp.]